MRYEPRVVQARPVMVLLADTPEDRLELAKLGNLLRLMEVDAVPWIGAEPSLAFHISVERIPR